jgi:hypothetical protein
MSLSSLEESFVLGAQNGQFIRLDLNLAANSGASPLYPNGIENP